MPKLILLFLSFLVISQPALAKEIFLQINVCSGEVKKIEKIVGNSNCTRKIRLIKMRPSLIGQGPVYPTTHKNICESFKNKMCRTSKLIDWNINNTKQTCEFVCQNIRLRVDMNALSKLVTTRDRVESLENSVTKMGNIIDRLEKRLNHQNK